VQFESERALSQALRLLDYVALPGAAWLLSGRGDVTLSTGTMAETESAAAARAIAEHLSAHARRDWVTEPGRWSSLVEGGCLYSTSVGQHLLCVLARGPISPADVFARMERTAALLGRMLGTESFDVGGRGRPGSGPRRR
jgi:hypothetical protein